MPPRADGAADDEQLPVVGYLPPLCKACGSARRFTYGQRGRKRYHCCLDCGARYRSIEVSDPRDLLRPPFCATDGAR